MDRLNVVLEMLILEVNTVKKLQVYYTEKPGHLIPACGPALTLILINFRHIFRYTVFALSSLGPLAHDHGIFSSTSPTRAYEAEHNASDGKCGINI